MTSKSRIRFYLSHVLVLVIGFGLGELVMHLTVRPVRESDETLSEIIDELNRVGIGDSEAERRVFSKIHSTPYCYAIHIYDKSLNEIDFRKRQQTRVSAVRIDFPCMRGYVSAFRILAAEEHLEQLLGQ